MNAATTRAARATGIVYLAIFVASVLVFYFVSRPQHSVEAAPGTLPVAPASHASEASRVSEVAPSAPRVNEPVAPAPVAPMTAEHLRELIDRSHDAEEGEVRGDAIRDLASAAAPEAVDALTQVLQSDPDVRNQLLAVNSLVALARRGVAVDSVKTALAAASEASDENIATSARDGLRALAR